MCDLRSNLPLYYDFYRVAKCQNIAKASENYISQSNLSRNIRSLEGHLNLNLLIRNNKGVFLTLDGERLFESLKEIFEKMENSQINNTEMLNGSIVIGTTRNIADNKLADYLVKFRRFYPSIKIQIITDSATNLNEYLINKKIDVLLDYLPNINFARKNNFIVKPVSEFQTCFACSLSFYEKYGDRIKELKDLQNYDLVIPGSSRRRQMLDELLQSKGILFQPVVEMPDSKLMKTFIKQIDAIGYFVKEEIINDKDVKILNIKETLPSNAIGIIYDEHLNIEAKKFVDLIINNN